MTARLAEAQSVETTGKAPGAGQRLALVATLACFVVAACVYFFQLGQLPLFNPDEALYAEPAREMLETGEYITTQLNYVVRFTKPPLVIWAMAASMALMGVTEFACRFFGALCGAILVAVTHMFVTRYAGMRAGLIAAACLIPAPLMYGTARESITDMPLALFMASALFCLFSGIVERRRSVLLLGYSLVGLAVMTKGPVGLLLPGLICGLFIVLKGSVRQSFSILKPHWGLLIVLAIAAPWFITEIAVTDGAYFNEFILRENFQRFTDVVDSHKGPIWYHIAAVAGGFFPWSLFLPQAILSVALPLLSQVGRASSQVGRASSQVGRASRREREHESEGGSGNSTSNLVGRVRAFIASVIGITSRLDLSGDFLLYVLLWSVITIAFFSASVSKLLPYTLPAFPALAALVAVEIDRCLKTGSKFRILIPVSIVGIIYGAGALLLPLVAHKARDFPQVALAPMETGLYACFAVVALALVLASLNRLKASISIFLSCQIALLLYVTATIIPLFSQSWEGSLPALSRYCAATEHPIIVFDMRKPSVVFYARRQIMQVWSWQVLISELARIPDAWILTRAKNADSVSMLPGMSIHKQEGAFVLIEWSNPEPVPAGVRPSESLFHIQR